MKRALLRAVLAAAGAAAGAAGAWAQLTVSEVAGGVETAVTGTIAFPETAVGDTAAVHLRVRNPGAASATLSAISFTGAAFSLPGTYVFGLPYVLSPEVASQPAAPGTFFDFYVGFTPAAAGAFTGTLSVNGQAYGLTGTGAAPGSGAEPVTVSWGGVTQAAGAALSFGRVQLGSQASQTVTLTNPGTASVTVKTVSVTGAGFSGPQGLSLPLTLGAGASAQFQIVFAPTVATAEPPGTLNVEGRLFVLTGSGFAPPFPQPQISFGAANAASGQPDSVSVTLPQAYPIATTLQMTMTFTAATPDGQDDNAVGFTSGQPRAVSVTFPAGQTKGVFAGGSQTSWQFQTGTTEGKIGFSLAMADGSAATAEIDVAAEAIQLDSATAVAEPGQIVVSITGFDNTHAGGQMTFTFLDAKGNAVAPGAITVDASKTFAQYFAGDQGAGGVFALRAAFPVTGAVGTVASVQAQLTNPAGTAQTQTIQF